MTLAAEAAVRHVHIAENVGKSEKTRDKLRKQYVLPLKLKEIIKFSLKRYLHISGTISNI